MVQVIEEWWDLHKADASTYIDNGQIRLPFDIDTYKVDY
jgi:hypothetical protein